MRWLADENFNNDIVRALLRRRPGFDIVRAQDVGLSGADDMAILEWARHERVLHTHDVTTLTAHAYHRAALGERMPGVFEVKCSAHVFAVVLDILLLTDCSKHREWEGQVRYLPLR